MRKARTVSKEHARDLEVDGPPYKSFPSAVRLFGQEWQIKYVSPVDRDESLMGLCDVCDRTIYIEETLSPEAMLDTLIHEIAHAYFETSALTLAPELEESLAKFIATAIIDLLRANGGIVGLIR